MKRVWWVLVALFVVAVALLGFAAYSANSLVGRFKPEIERAASDALQASVTFGDISASIFPSIKVKVQEARVAQPGSSAALVLKGLVLHVELLPLLSRRLVIETVSFDEPSLIIVKTKTGMYFEGLPRRQAVAGAATPPSLHPEHEAVPLAVAVPGATLNIDLRAFEINHATVTLRDAENQKETVLHDINLTAALQMTGGTAALSKVRLQAELPGKQGVSVTGSGQSFDVRTGQLALGELQASVTGGVITLSGTANLNTASADLSVASDGIKLDEVLRSVGNLTTAMANVELHGAVKPNVKAVVRGDAYSVTGEVTLQDIAFRNGTLAVSAIAGILHVSGDSRKQTVTTDGISFALQDTPGKIVFTASAQGDAVHVDPLSISALAGSLSGTAEVSQVAPYRFAAHLEGSGFSVAQALAVASPRARLRMEGVVSKLAANVRGRAEGDMAQSLQGTAALGLTRAVLKGFNLGAAVTEAAKRYPVLAVAVDAPRLEKDLSSKDTTIDSLTADFSIGSGWAQTSNLVVLSALFKLNGSGRISFETDVDLDTTITLNRELSEAMTGKAPELRPVLNSDGTLSIPVIVKGQLPNLDVRPDVTLLMEAGARNVVGGTVGKALEKALGGGKEGGKLLDRLFGK